MIPIPGTKRIRYLENNMGALADIVNVIKFEELDDVILCGHSYAGRIVSALPSQVSSTGKR